MTVIDNMRQRLPIFIFFTITAFLLSFQNAQAVDWTTVRCPVPPKSQGIVNHIFFPFYEKTANIKTHIPRFLTLLDPIYTEGRARCLTAQSYAAFVTMNDALYKDTSQNLVVTSAWRSTATQMYFARLRGEFAAAPGRSEHQLGTAVDLDILGSKEEDYFGDSAVYQWMVAHASEYGFVQSFDAVGQESSGVPNEPWHWRYVGPTIATKMKLQSININEYLYNRMEAKKKGLIY